MRDRDFRAILSSIENAIEVFKQRPAPQDGSARKAYEKLQELHATVLRAQREMADTKPERRRDAAG